MDLAGGTLDIWPLWLFVPRAATVNAAISLRARAEVLPAARCRVVNRQRNLDAEADAVESLFEHPSTALAARLIHFFLRDEPAELRFHTAAPPGSGLGGSSALGMAMAGALNEASGAGWSVPELVRIVVDTEARILRTATGSQDQFAAGLGGVHIHHWESPAPRSEPLPWGAGADDPLATRFVVVFTGEAHSSGNSNRRVLERLLAGEPEAVRGIEEIAEAAFGMRAALLAGDWDGVAAHLDREWAGRKSWAPGVTTPTLERFEEALRSAGARAVKACGAAAGGTVLALCRPADRGAVEAAARAAGGEVLPARTDPVGLRPEHPEPERPEPERPGTAAPPS